MLLLQCRMQVQGADSVIPKSSRYISPLDCAIKTVKADGVSSIGLCISTCIMPQLEKLIWKLSGQRHFSWRLYDIVKRIYRKLCLLHCLWVCSLLHAFEATSWLASAEAFDWCWYWGHDWGSRRCSSKHFHYISLFVHLLMVRLIIFCTFSFGIWTLWPPWISCKPVIFYILQKLNPVAYKLEPTLQLQVQTSFPVGRFT